MIQKLRDKMFGVRSLHADDRGSLSFIQLAALIIGPIVAGSIAMGAITSLRLGGDLAGMFTRDAQMHQMVERLQMQLSNITEMDVKDETAFTAHDQPSRRSAYYVPSDGMPEVCVTNEWSLDPDDLGTLTLRNITYTHTEDSCDSDIESQKERTVTGLDAGTVFDYENAYGRDLTFDEGAEAGSKSSKNERPEGLFNNEWDYASPGFVTLNGQMNQVIGSTPLNYTAKTSLKQLRPGVVASELGELGPPLIERIARGGDVFRAQMSALTVLNDPRTIIEWSWRSVQNVGSTPTSQPAEAQWGEWSSWTTLDHFDETVLQGAKWQVQAKYRVVLEDRSAESDTVTMTWVRPIDTPAAPTVKITLNTATATATVGVVPAVCAPGTTPNTQSRTSVNDGAWGAWTGRTAAPYEATQTVPQGSQLAANGEARCVTTFAQSSWAAAQTKPTVVQPIVTAPTVDSVTAALAGPTATGTGRAVLSGCPAGTTYSAFWRSRVDAGTDVVAGSFGAVNVNPTFNSGRKVAEGSRFRAGITAKCVSPYFTGSPEAAADSAWVINPIVSTPTVSNPANSLNGSSHPVTTADIGGCPARFGYDVRLKIRKNETPTTAFSYGPFSAASAGRASVVSSGPLNEGDRFQGGLSARCTTPYAQGPAVEATTNTWFVRPITSRMNLVNVRFISVGTEGHLWADISTPCPANLTPNSQTVLSKDYQPLWSYYSAWSTANRTGSLGWNAGFMNEGQRFAGGYITRCTSPYAQGPDSGFTTNGHTVRPITTVPGGQFWVSRNGGDTYAGVNSMWGCPAGTTVRWHFASQENSGAWSGWSNWTPAVTSFYARSIGYGSSMAATFRVKCVSDFTEGPENGDTRRTSTRPYPAPPTPGGLAVSGSVARWCSNQGWSGVNFSWSAASYASYYGVESDWRNAAGGRSYKNFGTTSGRVMGLSATGPVSGTLNVVAYVTAYNSSGASGRASTGASQAGGCIN